MFAKRTTIIAIVLLTCFTAGSATATPHAYPKTANFYTGDPHPYDCERLSRYDLVVMPGGMEEIVPELFSELRRLNPDILLMAYYPVCLMWPDSVISSGTAQGLYDKVAACDWWLYDNKGYIMGNPDYLWILNFTGECPEDPYGRTIGEWFASYIADHYLSTGLWDGIFLDGCFEDPRWLNYSDTFFQNPPAQVDSDRNGVADDPDELKASWYAELTGFVSSLRSRVGPGAVIVANDKQFMHGLLNGGIRESFPNMHGDWDANMFSDYGYVTNCDMFLSSPATASMILCHDECKYHTPLEPYRSSSFKRLLRFTLASSLLGDGYYVLEGIAKRCLWWEDLYDVDLGLPVSDAYLDSIYSQSGDKMRPIWRRDFEKGYVLCNPFDNYIYTIDNEWIMSEDGMIEITESDAPLTVAVVQDSMPTVLDREVRRIRIETEVNNPSDHAAPAFVWSETRLGHVVMNTGPVLEVLVGREATDTLAITVGFPTTLELETYSIAINVAGPDMEVLQTTTFSVRRTVEFPSDETTLYDNQEPNPDTNEEDSFLIYPQPAAFSSGETLRMEVRSKQTSADENCSIRMFDVRGRLVRSLYEGVYGEGLSMEIGLTNKGGEKIAPGLYIVILEMGNLAQTRKIVLLK